MKAIVCEPIVTAKLTLLSPNMAYTYHQFHNRDVYIFVMQMFSDQAEHNK